uniref:Uncharacterized protein n=1 Tax=viral metagenome TaxID=1070528 RepID=A0A6C0K8K9_9ZZZZ
MATNIDLKDYITDDVNVIEVFFGADLENTSINVNITRDIESIIEKKYKKYKEEKYKSYHHKDKVYTYELSNDNQFVSSKIMTKSNYLAANATAGATATGVFIVSYKIDKFPQYIFPCSNDIDNISTYSIKEFKINNRISLMLRSDYSNSKEVAKSFYIEYRHSPNVEIDKINEYINNLVATYINC